MRIALGIRLIIMIQVGIGRKVIEVFLIGLKN